MKAGPVPGLDELLARAEGKARGGSEVRAKQATASGPSVQAVANGARAGGRAERAGVVAEGRGDAVVGAARVDGAPAAALDRGERGGGGGRRGGGGGRARDQPAGPLRAGRAGGNPAGRRGAGQDERRAHRGGDGDGHDDGDGEPARPREGAPGAGRGGVRRAQVARVRGGPRRRERHDPAGEDTPEVIALRHRVFEGITSKGPK